MDHHLLPLPLKDLLEGTFNKKTIRWLVPDCGLSATLRYSVFFEDNSSVFVKAATDEETAGWLRREHLVLTSLRQKFAPAVINWLIGPEEWPVLVTQDLSNAYWPASHQGVSWRNGDIELLLEALGDVSDTVAPTELPLLKNEKTALWLNIAGDPGSFLNLGLCSEKWFTAAIDALMQAEKGADLAGAALVHGDVRSDNICVLDGQVMFVDWSHAAIGNKNNDLATLLPTLYLEGGPVPYQVMPGGGGYAALQTAWHIQRLEWDTGMPNWLKKVFVKLIAIELEWAASCIGLDKPDGIAWT
jgi:hypothetical protein